MIRIGIVGCGRILAAHLEGYRLLREAGFDQFEITALCSRRAEDAASYIKRGEGPPQRKAVSDIPGDPLAVGDQYLSDFQPETQVEVFTDFRDMIGSNRVDAINDFSTHGMHHQVAADTFAAKKHLLSQKPLGVTLAAARQMCEQAETAGVTFGVFENLRADVGVRHQHWAFSETGPLGEFQLAAMGNIGTWWAPDLIVAETPWRHSRIEGGGIALDLAPHFFDMIRYISGSEVASVSGRTHIVEPTRYLLRDGERVDPITCDADDTFFANFELQSGASGTLFGSWAGHAKATTVDDAPVYYGSKGRVCGDVVHLDDELEPLSLAALYEEQAPAEMQVSHFPKGFTNDFALSQLDWLEAITSGRKPETDGNEGLIDLACAYAVVESDLARREVTIDELLDGRLRNYQAEIDSHFGIASN